jgi:hypothetical protein
MFAKALSALLLLALWSCGQTPAYARTHHAHHRAVHWASPAKQPAWPHSTFFGPRWTGDQQPFYKSDSAPRSAALGPRPSRWCGWFMRQVRGVLDPAFNLAWNWSHWGHATDAHPGAVAVWHHHVGEVASGACPSGQIMLHSGNDGHAVRTRCVPLRGAVFREA